MQQHTPIFQYNGKWYDYFSGDSITVENSTLSITLNPGEFHIYTSKKLPTPEADILLSTENNENVPTEFSHLHKIIQIHSIPAQLLNIQFHQI